MGNADLRELAVLETVDAGDLSGVLAVDAHNWLYRYLTTTVRFTSTSAYTTAAGEEVPNLLGALQGLAKLLESDLTPVLVFDGAAAELKAEEIAERRERRAAAAERAAEAAERGDAVEAARLDSQSQRLTEVIQRTTRDLLERLDVPYLEAPGAGEAQAAHLALAGDADYVGTEDYDALLFCAPLTVRKLTTSDDPELMDHAATLEALEVTHEQLVDAAILMGTDYNDGLHGFGPKTAVAAVREHGDLWGVLEAEDEHVEAADRIRELFLDPAVTDDYELDLDVRPDVEAAREYVVEDWEVPAGEVSRALERIEAAATQTGLDRWT